jgi:cysteine desulfurase
VPLIVGLGTACCILSQPEHFADRALMAQLRDKFISNIISIGGNIHLNGPDLRLRHPGNANLCFSGYSSQDILQAMQPFVAASSGSACTSGITELSYVLRAIGLTEEDAASSIRFSLGRFTTEEDIDCAVVVIKDVLSRL